MYHFKNQSQRYSDYLIVCIYLIQLRIFLLFQVFYYFQKCCNKCSCVQMAVFMYFCVSDSVWSITTCGILLIKEMSIRNYRNQLILQNFSACNNIDSHFHHDYMRTLLLILHSTHALARFERQKLCPAKMLKVHCFHMQLLKRLHCFSPMVTHYVVPVSIDCLS